MATFASWDMLRLSSCSGISGQVLSSPNFSFAREAFCAGQAMDDVPHDLGPLIGQFAVQGIEVG